MTGPRVSVVMPTRNRAGLLARAARSVLDQTFDGSVELVIVDDASEDATPAAVRALDDPRVTYVRNRAALGGGGARNAGIDAARGELTGFIDDDDEWLPGKLAVQLEALADCDAVLCGYRESTTGKEVVFAGHRVRVLDLARRNLCGTSALLARADVVRDERFDPSLPSGQDWDLFVRLAHRHVLGNVPDALLILDTGGHERITNAASGQSMDALERRLAAIEKHRALIGEYWYRVRVANQLLSYISRSPRPLPRLAHVMRRCGLLPTGHVVSRRLWSVLARRLAGGGA